MAPELEKQLANLNPGEHLCPIYENAAERLAVVIPFIKHGLARREPRTIARTRTMNAPLPTIQPCYSTLGRGASGNLVCLLSLHGSR